MRQCKYVYQDVSLNHDVLYFQYVSEKIGGAKGTELDDEFVEMERVSTLWKLVMLMLP